MSGEKEEYILTQGEKRYDFSLQILNGDILRATCREENEPCKGEYVGDYTFEELKEVNKVFYDFENLEDALEQMDESITKNLCGVIDDCEMFEVVIYIDYKHKKAKVPLLLEWNGECKLHSGLHNPDKISKIENENERIRIEQEQLRRAIEAALSQNISRKEIKYNEINHYSSNDEIKIEPKGKTTLRSAKPQNPPQFDSNIASLEELDFITQNIRKYGNNIKYNLLYRGSRDGDSAQTFHNFCDRAKCSLTLIKATNGTRFGGYTTKGWNGEYENKQDPDAFVFSLDKKQIYGIIPNKDAIGAYPDFGPIFFGCQIRIFDNYFKDGGSTYKANRNYQTNEDFELSGGQQKFDISELEVFVVNF